MTTYTAIANSEVDGDSPITDTLMSRLRDNAIAMGEADPSVPSNLLPIGFLGTITTTSGSSQSLSGLTLTNYKFLLFVWNAVSQNATGGTFGIGAATACMNVLSASAANGISGLAWVELSTGIVVSASTEVASGIGSGGTIKVGATGYSTATTSVAVNTSGTFDAGSVRVYGLK